MLLNITVELLDYLGLMTCVSFLVNSISPTTHPPPGEPWHVALEGKDKKKRTSRWIYTLAAPGFLPCRDHITGALTWIPLPLGWPCDGCVSGEPSDCKTKYVYQLPISALVKLVKIIFASFWSGWWVWMLLPLGGLMVLSREELNRYIATGRLPFPPQ